MTKLNRRQFTAVATAAVATATTRRSVAQSPNEEFGVCIAGVNGRGGEHIRGFIKDKRTVVRAIVEVDESVGQRRAAQVEEKQGHRPEVFSDIRKAVEMDGVHIVTCAAPNHWHALMGVWAMQAGKDVYIEKPISHNVHEGRALVAAAAKYGRMVQTGTQCRNSSAVRDAMQFIHDGGIGEVNFARGLCYKRRKSIGPLGNYPIPEIVDFDLWSGPATFTDPKLTRQRFHYDWHWQRHYGNGDFGNQGPHQTDIARWGLGVDRHPDSIISYGGRLGYQAERKDPDYIDAGDTPNTIISLFNYGDKSITFETRGLDPIEAMGDETDKMFGKTKGNKVGVIFYGSEGYVAQIQYGYCQAYDKDMNPIKEWKAGGIGDEHFSNFIDACVSRDYGSLNASATEGHLSAAMSHLGNISYYVGEENRLPVAEIESELAGFASNEDSAATLMRTARHLEANGVDLAKTPMSLGAMLKFDPTAERFTNNDAANAWLSREYRKGFEVPAGDNV